MNKIYKNMNHGVEDSTFQCKMCGDCCRFFSPQIKYWMEKDEIGWKKMPENLKNFLDEINSAKHNKNYVDKHYKANIKFHISDKNMIYVPNKGEFLSFFEKNEKSTKYNVIYKEYLPEINNADSLDECLFLKKSNHDKRICSIHDIRPNLCRNYPFNHGGVCINQSERYFLSSDYLNFKIKEFGFILKFLNLVFPYFKEHGLEKELDLIMFLIDYGSFEFSEVEKFFKNIESWSQMDFKYAVKDLQRYGLVFTFNKDNIRMIESISSKSLKTHLGIK